MPRSDNKTSALLFGEKCAISVLQTHDEHKLQPVFPKQLQESTITPREAEQIARAMAAVAPHGALDNTRVDLYGTQVKDLQQRMVDNPRSAPLQRHLAKFNEITGLPDKTQMLPDAYHPEADAVWLPSGNPGVMMHELGHGIDFNAYPNTTPRMIGAGLYARLAPTLWKEHAAWNKGQKYFLEGAAQEKLPPDLVVKTLRDATRGKRMGLGSYWGAGLGGLLGGGLGALGTYHMLQNGVRGRAVGLPLALGLAGGSALGAMSGATLGNMAAESPHHDSPEAQQQYLDNYAKTYAKKHDVSLEEAHAAIQQFAKKRLAKSKSKTKKEKPPVRAKAAAVSIYDIPRLLGKLTDATGIARLPVDKNALRQALIAASVGGTIGGLKGYVYPGYDEKLDEEGRVISKKKITPWRSALQGAGIGAGTGAVANYAGQVLSRYNPEIDKILFGPAQNSGTTAT
jgi:hypothetical protein